MDYIGTVAKENGLSKPQAKKAVDLFFHEMTEALVNGDRVETRGLCSIFVEQ